MDSPSFLFYLLFLLQPTIYTHSESLPVLWVFTQRLVTSQEDITTHTIERPQCIWPLKLQTYFMFSQHFTTVSTTDEHILFYLSYHSVGYLTMYVFGRLLSFRHIKMLKFTLFLI